MKKAYEFSGKRILIRKNNNGIRIYDKRAFRTGFDSSTGRVKKEMNCSDDRFAL